MPVVAVVDQPLRRHRAFAGLVAAPATVGDRQPLPSQRRGANGLEVRQVQLARPDGLYTDAAGEVGAAVAALCQQAVQA